MVLYEDNQAAIAMINESKPAPRSRHIDVQCFVVQEWQRLRQVSVKYLKTDSNVSDVETKALGWLLHSRHVQRAVGHHRPVWG